jgi:hypothetical protein
MTASAEHQERIEKWGWNAMEWCSNLAFAKQQAAAGQQPAVLFTEGDDNGTGYQGPREVWEYVDLLGRLYPHATFEHNGEPLLLRTAAEMLGDALRSMEAVPA